VKYQNWRSTSDDAAWKARQRLIAQALHEKHAPEMLDVMLKLKGLYVKLGQVMSVTVLPVPESYRVLFRTLQSDVPGWESFESSVKPVLEQELKQSVDHIFEFIEPTPAGAASIGQAHRARLVSNVVSANDNRDVIIKVQYPDASWQVPADIQCVGDFLKVCVWFGVVDESALKLSFDEFSRQFLGELDYEQERSNLEQVYQSSLDLSAPYKKHHVLIPKVYNHLCTKKIITMTYLPGPKLEAEAKRQLAALGIDTSKYKLSDIVKTAASEASQKHNQPGELVRRVTKRVDPKHSPFLSQLTTRVGVDTLLWTVRLTRRLILWSQALAVSSLESLPRSWIPSNWSEWANDHRFAAAQAKQLNLTKKWMDALFDVHGHQIFNLGLFNGDPHPGKKDMSRRHDFSCMMTLRDISSFC
jgi:aarF domain-containing kinase